MPTTKESIARIEQELPRFEQRLGEVDHRLAEVDARLKKLAAFSTPSGRPPIWEPTERSSTPTCPRRWRASTG